MSAIAVSRRVRKVPEVASVARARSLRTASAATPDLGELDRLARGDLTLALADRIVERGLGLQVVPDGS